jgi:hypothetical protein
MKSYGTNDAAMLMKADTSIYKYMYHSAASKHWVTTTLCNRCGGGMRVYVFIRFHGTGDASVRFVVSVRMRCRR